MQALYAFSQDEDLPRASLEKDLFRRIHETGRAYRYQFVFLVEVADRVERDAEMRLAKHLPSESDRQFSRRFYHNPLVRDLRADEVFRRLADREHLSAVVDTDVVRMAYSALKDSPIYADYMESPEGDLEAERRVVREAFETVFWLSEDVEGHLEDQFPTWDDDVDLVIPRVQHAIKHWVPGQPGAWSSLDLQLPPESHTFVRSLLAKVLEHTEELDQLVMPRLDNWELERVSLLDRILIRMALAEMLYFDTVPVKVSINEYIDISKVYSTPRSKDFINGVLDNLLKQLKEEGRIKKRGRGLVE